jgi:hypothetical protein
MPEVPITIVSGLPRSGTSMMMRMLEAGGLEVLTDGVRVPDEDNPHGYYEFEPVKKLESDSGWLSQAQGKVLKVVSPLLRHLPREFQYRVIFMERDLREVLASQRRMLLRRGRPVDEVPDEEMAETFRRHVERLREWLARQPNFAVLYVDHREVLERPSDAAIRVASFLGLSLDAERMAAAVDPALYRQRR